ncbi:MAG: cytochrome P450, partial [Bdellovibrionales bacterium]|nr:cytochrome P450 [Bdellovibrionales bacterium]
MGQHPPGPNFFSFLQSWGRNPRQPLTLFAELKQKYGDVVSLPMGRTPFLLISDPVGIKHFLSVHPSKYVKGWTYDPIRDVLGTGLLTSDGAHWKAMRGLLNPIFHREKMQGMLQTLAREVRDWSQSLQAAAEGSVAVDVVDLFSVASMKVIESCFLGDSLETDEKKKFLRLVRDSERLANERYLLPMKTSLRIPTLSQLSLNRVCKELDEIILGVIQRRRERPDFENPSLLDLLIVHLMSAENPIRMKDVRDEIMTFIVAGYTTTAVSLAWTLYLLSQNPKVAEQMREELNSVFGNLENPLHLGLFQNVPLTQAVLKESMRLFPPAWVFGRECIQDDQILGFNISKGTVVMTSPYLVHRDSRFFR